MTECTRWGLTGERACSPPVACPGACASWQALIDVHVECDKGRTSKPGEAAKQSRAHTSSSSRVDSRRISLSLSLSLFSLSLSFLSLSLSDPALQSGEACARYPTAGPEAGVGCTRQETRALKRQHTRHPPASHKPQSWAPTSGSCPVSTKSLTCSHARSSWKPFRPETVCPSLDPL